MILVNTRFYKGETKNDPELGREHGQLDGSLRERLLWLKRMVAAGVKLDSVNYNSVIHAHNVKGNVEGAKRWLEQMLHDGLELNVVTFSAMIDACAKGGNLACAELRHDKMTPVGVKPNAHSYSAVVNACAKAGGVGGAEAAELWLHRFERTGVRAHGLKPHLVTHATLACPFAYRGDWIKAENIR